MKRRDRLEVGRLLDNSEVGLLVVTTKDLETAVGAVLTRAHTRTHGQLSSSRRKVQKALDDATRGKSDPRR